MPADECDATFQIRQGGEGSPTAKRNMCLVLIVGWVSISMSVLHTSRFQNFSNPRVHGIGLVYAQMGGVKGELWSVCKELVSLKCPMMVTIGAANKIRGRICPNAQEFSSLGPVLLVSIRRPIPQARAKMSQ